MIRAICLWALVTLAWCAFVVALSTRLMAQEVGCYQIDRFGLLCVPSTGEIFVHEAHDDYDWINKGQYRGPDGSLCCGPSDCEAVPKERVQETPSGFYLPDYKETVPHAEAVPSEDGRFIRCHDFSGYRRCFFAPLNGF